MTFDARVNGAQSYYSLNDRAYMYDVIERLSKLLGMTLVYPPIVASFPFANSELEKYTQRFEEQKIDSSIVTEMRNFLNKRANEESGVSGTSIWLESHATIHTWPEQQYFAADIFSCKIFDAEAASKYLIDAYKVERASIHRIIRSDDLKSNVTVARYHHINQPKIIFEHV